MILTGDAAKQIDELNEIFLSLGGPQIAEDVGPMTEREQIMFAFMQRMLAIDVPFRRFMVACVEVFALGRTHGKEALIDLCKRTYTQFIEFAKEYENDKPT